MNTLCRYDIFKKVGLSHLFLCFAFLLSIGRADANNRIDSHPQIYAAYQDILKLKIESGREQLNRIIPNQAQHGHYNFTLSLADVLEMLVTEDRSLYKAYEDNEDAYLKGVRDLDEEDPHRNYYIAEIKIQWALVKILFGDDMKAGWALKSANGYIEDNTEDFPEFVLNHKTTGSLHILFSTIPENYQWFLKFFGIKGNLLQGWDELNLIEKDNPFWVETGIIRALTAVNIINDETISMAVLDELLNQQKDNLLSHYLYNSALSKYAKSEKALSRFQKLLFTGDEYIGLDFVNYKLGNIYMQRQNYGLARYYYSKFLNNYNGTNFVKDSWYKTFLSHWLEGDSKMSEIHWAKATKEGTTSVDADKNANGILNGNEYPHRELTKARLAIDGGYFELAEEALSNIQQGGLTTKKEESEYFYRYARLYHKLGQDEDAIFHYLNAIKKIGKGNWYFGAAACLYTGYIYESQMEFEKAEYYYNKVLSFKKHKYKDGLDNKAKAALQLLERKQLAPDELIDN